MVRKLFYQLRFIRLIRRRWIQRHQQRPVQHPPVQLRPSAARCPEEADAQPGHQRRPLQPVHQLVTSSQVLRIAKTGLAPLNMVKTTT